jgi:hypothetical protein
VLQTAATFDIGDGGIRLGYNRIDNNLAVEFDTRRQTSLADPNDNHISVHAGVGVDPGNAHQAFALGTATPGFDLDNGGIHTVRITYDSSTLRVFADDLTNPVLAVSVNLGSYNLIGGTRAFVGFTAGVNGPTTGNRDGVTDGSANHDILNWSFENGPPANPVPEPSTLGLLAGGMVGLAGYVWRRKSKKDPNNSGNWVKPDMIKG